VGGPVDVNTGDRGRRAMAKRAVRGRANGRLRSVLTSRGHAAWSTIVVVWYTLLGLFDPDLLDDDDPFEIDVQAAHRFKHPNLGLDDIHEV